MKNSINELIQFILTKDFGETIDNEKCAKILKINLNDEEQFKKYKSIMGRIKKNLIDYGYILKTVSGIGYYIMKPKEISSYCYRKYMTGTIKLLDKSEHILECTKTDELSQVRTEEYNNVCNLNKSLKDEIFSSIRQSGYYRRKQYYDNLED